MNLYLPEGALSLTERNKEYTEGYGGLERALEDMRAGMSLDACCVGVECAMAALGEVDGREIGEEIVSSIFSRFCVGK